VGQAESITETLCFNIQDLETYVRFRHNPLAAHEKFKSNHDMIGDVRGKGGFYGIVPRIRQPMCITRMDVDFLLEILNIVFVEL